MSYKVLSLKLRPQIFNDVIGQEHVTKTLQNAINLNRLAHGYIFAGPGGVGNTTTARILAKALNCQNIDECNPCGSCSNCIEITNGSNLDVQELDGASNRGIDEIRDLRESVKYPANRGKYRIYIIDEVHMLTREAFNALLKTLEEPPSHVVFIMATTESHKIPQTILSRTQRFDFKPISINNINNYLKIILNNENIQYDNDSLHIISQKASGSLRDALSLMDQIIAYSDQKIDIETVSKIVGIIKENIFLELLITLEKKEIHNVMHQLNSVLNEGYSIVEFITGFNEYIRNCMLYQAGKKLDVQLSEDSTNWLLKSKFTVTDFLRRLDLCLKFESNLKFVKQAQISLESLFIKLSVMDLTIDISELIANSSQNISFEKENSVSKSTKSAKINIAKTEVLDTNGHSINNNLKHDNISSDKLSNKDIDKPVKEISLDDINREWPQVIDRLENSNSKIAHFLEGSILSSWNGNELEIKFENGNEFQLKTLEKDIIIIESEIEKIFSKKIKIKFQINKISKNSTTKKVEDNEHPLSMDVIEKFNGEIIR